MKGDQNDKQVQLTQEGRDVLLQALVKKDDGRESFFSDKKNGNGSVVCGSKSQA